MRRIAYLFGIAAVLAIMLAIATPWLLSSDIVKQRIASRIEELTGLKTTLKGSPKLTLIPFLGIKLKDVVVANPPELASIYGTQPFVSVDSLKGRLKLLPAMLGRPELADLKLVRPQFNLRVSRDGKANWNTEKGALAALVGMAARHARINSGAADPTQDKPPPIRLGDFEIVNGMINYQNDQQGETAEVTSLNMRLSWPSSNTPASASGSMVWQGEVVEFSGSIENPMGLFFNQSSNLTASIISQPVTALLSGAVQIMHSPQFSGKIKASTPSARQLLRWIGYDLAPGSTPGELSIASKFSAVGSSFKFQDATISLDGNSGTGFIDIKTLKNKRVKFEGTLAFDNLDFNPYFEALDTNRGDDQSDRQIANIELIDEFDLDLRFSAKNAILGPLAMTSMAATAQANDGKVIIDIGEASMFGGMIQAQIQASAQNGVPAGEMKLNLFDVDLEDLGQFISPVGIKIIGKGTATVLLKSSGRSFSDLVQRLNGSTTITAEKGRIEGLDLAKIARDGSSAIVLDSNEVLAKGTDFSNLAIGIHIANGIALFEKTSLEGDLISARVDGKADLWRKSLAMNGRVIMFKPGDGADGQDRVIDLDIPFFIGGTLAAPLFAPDLLSPRPAVEEKKPAVENLSRGRPNIVAKDGETN